MKYSNTIVPALKRRVFCRRNRMAQMDDLDVADLRSDDNIDPDIHHCRVDDD